jgi:penicillin-binding protein 1A
MDAWFAGFQPTITAVTWIGYDTPRKLGDKETGGGLSLPVWISFMETALKGVPVVEPVVPEGITNVGGEWYFEEFIKGDGVTSLKSEDKADPAQTAPIAPIADEKKKILELFKN